MWKRRPENLRRVVLPEPLRDRLARRVSVDKPVGQTDPEYITFGEHLEVEQSLDLFFNLQNLVRSHIP